MRACDAFFPVVWCGVLCCGVGQSSLVAFLFTQSHTTAHAPLTTLPTNPPTAKPTKQDDARLRLTSELSMEVSFEKPGWVWVPNSMVRPKGTTHAPIPCILLCTLRWSCRVSSPSVVVVVVVVPSLAFFYVLCGPSVGFCRVSSPSVVVGGGPV